MKYGIGSIIDYDVGNEDLRWFMKKHQKESLWKDTLEAKYNVKRDNFYDNWKPYHRFDRLKGRTLLLWRCGMLKFGGYWREYNTRNNIPTECFHPLCGQTDTYEHSLSCLFTATRMRKGDPKWEDFRTIEYLMSLNAEREKWNRPII